MHEFAKVSYCTWFCSVIQFGKAIGVNSSYTEYKGSKLDSFCSFKIYFSIQLQIDLNKRIFLFPLHYLTIFSILQEREQPLCIRQISICIFKTSVGKSCLSQDVRKEVYQSNVPFKRCKIAFAISVKYGCRLGNLCPCIV